MPSSNETGRWARFPTSSPTSTSSRACVAGRRKGKRRDPNLAASLPFDVIAQNIGDVDRHVEPRKRVARKALSKRPREHWLQREDQRITVAARDWDPAKRLRIAGGETGRGTSLVLTVHLAVRVPAPSRVIGRADTASRRAWRGARRRATALESDCKRGQVCGGTAGGRVRNRCSAKGQASTGRTGELCSRGARAARGGAPRRPSILDRLETSPEAGAATARLADAVPSPPHESRLRGRSA
jgi:hypothetical protein